MQSVWDIYLGEILVNTLNLISWIITLAIIIGKSADSDKFSLLTMHLITKRKLKLFLVFNNSATTCDCAKRITQIDLSPCGLTVCLFPHWFCCPLTSVAYVTTRKCIYKLIYAVI